MAVRDAFRVSVRSLCRSPGFLAIAVGSIGLATGFAGSVFSVAYATFFAPMPFPEPARLLELWQTERPGSHQPSDYLAPERMLGWIDAETRHVERIAATGMGLTLVTGRPDGTVRVDAAPVVGDWFTVMGVTAARGRTLVRADALAGAAPAVVLSERFARRHSLDLGSTLELSGVTYTVVGVMPRAFEARERVWMSTAALPVGLMPVAYAGVARVRDGATVEQAVQEIERMAEAEVAADSARFAGLGATARPYGSMARSPDSPRMWLLAAAAGAVLLLGTSNLTQLFLARAQARNGALAVRAALGGNSWQIVRGLCVEAAIVGALGGGLGLVLTTWGSRSARVFLGESTAQVPQPGLVLPVIALSAILTALIVVLVAAEPLRRVRSVQLQPLLHGRAGGSMATPAQRRAQRLSVSVQVATCVVLLAVVLVVATAYRTLVGLELGYDAEEVVQIVPDYTLGRMDRAAQWDFARRMAERLRERPEVASVALWEDLGEDYPPRPEYDAVPDGPSREIARSDRLSGYYLVDPGSLETLGIELLGGRSLSRADSPGEPIVALASSRATEAWWPGENPLGRRVKLGREGPWITIVGVVEDLHSMDQLGPLLAIRSQYDPLLFIPARQLPEPPPGWRSFGCCDGVMLGVRPRISMDVTADMLRRELAIVAPELPIADIGSMLDLQVRRGISGRPLVETARLVAIIASVALVLAVIGILGIVRETMGRRIREIGIRSALGAPASRILVTAAREALLTGVAGVSLGVVAAAALDPLLDRMVLDWTVQQLTDGVLDARVLGPSAALALVVVVGGAIGVAWRAARVDPSVVLRSD